jgi:mono/diheme cytochrome c family protein
MKIIQRSVRRYRSVHRGLSISLLYVVVILFCNTDPAVSRKINDSNQQQSVSELQQQAAQIFQQNCTDAGCHSGAYPQMMMTLTEEEFYNNIVNQPSLEKPSLLRVNPGKPDSSYLVMKILGIGDIEGTRMPFARNPLSEKQIMTIVEWVKSLVDTEIKESVTPKVALLPFQGWKVVNLPTTRMVDKGRWLFFIGHRFFPNVDTGYETFYGIDGSAAIFLNLGYAFSNNFFINLGRSNVSDDVEFYARYSIKQQYMDDPMPFSAAVQTSINWISEKRGNESRWRSQAFKFALQAIVAHQPMEGAGLLFAPGILINPDSETDSEDPLITLGLGGRIHVYKSISFVTEWTPIVSGYILTSSLGQYNRFDSWCAGFELSVGGHVFHIIATNSLGLTTDQYMRGGDLDIRDGDLRLGFNIFRMLDF